MPGSNPGPDRPFVTWSAAPSRLASRLTALSGAAPAWTQSPWLSIFSDASARKLRSSPVMKALGGLDLTDTVAAAEADAPSRDILPDFQRVAAKNSPMHLGFKPAARGAPSVTGTPLHIEYHPIRLVPESKIFNGKTVEQEEAAGRAGREGGPAADDLPNTLEEFDAMRAAKAAAAKDAAAADDIFGDEAVPQGRGAWQHTDAAGEYDKDLEEENHLNIVAAVPRPQALWAVGEGGRRGAREQRGVWRGDAVGRVTFTDGTPASPYGTYVDGPANDWMDSVGGVTGREGFKPAGSEMAAVQGVQQGRRRQNPKNAREEEEEQEEEPVRDSTQARWDEEEEMMRAGGL